MVQFFYQNSTLTIFQHTSLGMVITELEGNSQTPEVYFV